MGFIEVQYREAVMAEAIRIELNEVDLPLDQFEQALPGNQVIDHWECTAVNFVSAGPDGVATPAGAVDVRADVVFSLTTDDEAEQAGSGNPPDTDETTMRVFVRIRGTDGQDGAIDRELLGVQVNGIDVDPPDIPLGPVDLPAMDEGVPIVRSWAGRGAGNVIFRLGTPFAGPLGGPAIVDRVPADQDWALLLSGTLLEETVEAQMAGAVAASPEVELEETFVAHWQPHMQAVTAKGWVVAPDQCGFLNVDFSVELSSTVTFGFDAQADDPLSMTVRLTWDTSDWDTFRCAFGMAMIGGLIGGIVGGLVAIVAPPAGALIAGMGLGLALIALIAVPIVVEDIVDAQANAMTPDDMEQIASDDDSVTFRGTVPIDGPSVGGVRAQVNARVPSLDGLVLVGTLELPMTQRSLSLTVMDPFYHSGFSCDTMQWSSGFHGPKAVFSSQTPHFRLRRAPVVSAGWEVEDLEDLMSRRDVPLTVKLRPAAGGGPKLGAVAEMLVHTNAGMRWIRFEPVPAPPEEPSDAELMDERVHCKVEGMIDRPDDWPFGRFNPKWHVDPPPYEHLIRLWGVVYERLPAEAQVVFKVVEDRGRAEAAKEVGRVKVGKDGKVAEVIVTSATQRLVIDVEGRLSGPVAPRMRQQWLTPVAELPADAQLPGMKTRARNSRGQARLGNGRNERIPRRPRQRLTEPAFYHQGHWVVPQDGKLVVCQPVGAIEQRKIRGR